MKKKKLLTGRELADALGLPERTVKRLSRQKKIPVAILGYRTHRYRLPKVMKAMEKLTRRELGS